MELKTNCAIHNKFEIEVSDAKTGEIKRKETAYNIVLDSMWTKLCNGEPYFSSIVFGDGEGIPSPTRTLLFNFIGLKEASTVEIVTELPTSKWKRKIVLNPEEYVGQKITEFGIGYAAYSKSIVTHAMLKDSEGNPISILKTDTDVITIFATVYVTLSINDENIQLVGLHNNSNSLLNYLVGGASAPSGYFSLSEIQQPYAKLGSVAATWSADVTKRQRKTGVMRFSISNGNGYAGFLEFSNLFVIKLSQTSVFDGQPYTGVPLGIGDGQTREWILPSHNIRKSSIKIYSDGIIQSGIYSEEYFDYPVRMTTRYAGTIGSSYGVKISIDGTVMAFATKYSPFVVTCDWNNGAWIRRPDPDILPTGTARMIALSADAMVLAVAHTNAPYISTYDWIDGIWKKRSNPSVLPTGEARDVALSSDGRVMVILHVGTSKIETYDWDDNEWIARPPVASLPKKTTFYLALSSNGNVMAVRDGDPPYIATYEWDGFEWNKRPSPVDTPQLNSLNLVLSADGNTLISQEYYLPYIYVYDWTGIAWVKRDDPSSVPFSWPTSIAANSDCSVIALGHSTSPFLSVFDWRKNAWNKRTNLKSVSGRYATNIAIRNDGALVCTIHQDDPYVAMYEYIRSTRVKFENPPVLDQEIKADFIVDGINKTDQYVIDVSFAIQFGEGI